MSWSEIGTGANDPVVALAEHHGDRILGGWFTTAGSAPNGYWARSGRVCLGRRRVGPIDFIITVCERALLEALLEAQVEAPAHLTE